MMGGAPTIVWLRPGVGYEPAAARSMMRLEAELGRPHDCNSSYRDYLLQESMWKAWEAWVAGRGPKPSHSRAIAPWLSKHCMGLADDSDDWTTPGYIARAARHGWIRTAANDPTERHHFEYQWWRDEHRNDPAPAPAAAPDTLEDLMTAHVRLYLYKPNNNLLLVDHLNKTIRELGAKDTFERRQFDKLDKVFIEEPQWTNTFKGFSYVTKPNLAPGVTA